MKKILTFLLASIALGVAGAQPTVLPDGPRTIALMRGGIEAAAVELPSMKDKLLIDLAIGYPATIPGPDARANAKNAKGVWEYPAEALRIGLYGFAGRKEVTPSKEMPIRIILHFGGKLETGGKAPFPAVYLISGSMKGNWIDAAEAADGKSRGGFTLSDYRITRIGGETYAELVFTGWPEGDPWMGWEGGERL